MCEREREKEKRKCEKFLVEAKFIFPFLGVSFVLKGWRMIKKLYSPLGFFLIYMILYLLKTKNQRLCLVLLLFFVSKVILDFMKIPLQMAFLHKPKNCFH